MTTMVNTMRRSMQVAAGVLLIGGVAAAQAAPKTKVPSDVSVWKGIVLANDYQAHQLTVEGPKGGLHQFTIPAKATNQFKVQVGDTVTVRFVESVVLWLRRPGDASVAAPPLKVTVTPAGLPDIDEVKVVNVTCKITSVDMAARTIGFTDSTGKAYTFKVNPGVTLFNNAKAGDQVIISYNESTAIDVTK
jgi:hypothetical protein